MAASPRGTLVALAFVNAARPALAMLAAWQERRWKPLRKNSGSPSPRPRPCLAGSRWLSWCINFRS